MTPTPLDILRTVFGYQAFRPNQEQVIDTVVRGEDAFVLMPSGGGKSLCYQIPAMVRPGTGIVVSPLIALMKDQVDALCLNGVRAATLNSSLEPAAARKVLADFGAGRLDLLYVSPERAVSDAFLDRLAEVHTRGSGNSGPGNGGPGNGGPEVGASGSGGTAGGGVDHTASGGASGIALFAIDEAHCISQWGPDFRPEYVELRVLRERCPDVPLIALTATADPHTREDIRDKLALRRAASFISSFDRPNIRLRVVEKSNPHAQLQRFLDSHRGEAGIIYCTSRKRTEELAAHLCSRDVAAAAYHAGLPAAERDRVQEEFLSDRLQIVVATVAFGMGIDKTNVRFVVHWDLPQHLEGYYQEIGRAGRDGMPAEALLLFGWEDVPRVRALIESDSSGAESERTAIESHKLSSVVSFAQALTCRRRVLLGYLGETVEEDCGNCDVCLDPPELYDATVDAQKALSCVYRLGERFGLMHVIDVLRGSEKQRIFDLHHDRLSTYGIGADLSVDAWRSLLHQLIHLGYLRQEMSQYPVLQLTPAAAPVLRGKQELMLAKPRVRVPKESSRDRERRRKKGALFATGALGADATTATGDEALFEELRALRREIAQRENVPPYVVFHDTALREMSASCPTTPEELLLITGVGEVKLERFGEEFLALLQRWAEAPTP
jgi:ATP-dependent DNA helicase RecQ